MSTSTTLHSNAFNFMSFIQGQVDPRTGQYTGAITLPELMANQLSGPVVPLQLNFSPLNVQDSGFGKGWNLQLSQFDPRSGVLSLHTGETFTVQVGLDGTELTIPEKKIDSFHFYKEGDKRYRIDHKSGLIEILEVGQGEIAMPVQMLSPEGHSVTLEYVAFGTDPLLSSIRNADGTQLLSMTRTTNVLTLTLHPGTAFEARFVLNINDGQTTSIVLPTHDNASWRFGYTQPVEGVLCLNRVDTPAGGHETVVYSSKPHQFPGLMARKLPRVASHVRDPGCGLPPSITHYTYGDTDHNFLGFGSGIAWSDDGLDNLYKVNADYTYETCEIVWDEAQQREVRTTSRVFNKYHLLVLEKVCNKAEPDSSVGDAMFVTETTYFIDPDLEFSDQPAYCQLPQTVSQTWYYANVIEPRHHETVQTTYDNFGNLLTQIGADGVTETSTWYDKEGEDGCPPDPQGFVRNIKSKTVTPAPSSFGAAPTLQTLYRYDQYLGLNGASPWLVLSHEALKADDKNLQNSTFSYIEAPNDMYTHGRKLQDIVAFYDRSTPDKTYKTTTDYEYNLTTNTLAGETVLQTTNTVIGYDDIPDERVEPGEPEQPSRQVRKVFTVEHSLLNGQPLLNRDDNNVEIAYEYDLLGRVTKETVAPNNADYIASRTYTYALTNEESQEPASQSATDVKGVKTISYLDGFNRVIKETRRDADGLGGNPDAFRDIYSATYNHLEQLTAETVIDWERAKDVPLTSRFSYDEWAQQCSVLRPDGVMEHEVSNPVYRTTTKWIEGLGKTISTLNLFDKPVCIERKNTRNELYSEHFYKYDGLGRTAEEIDTVGSWTRYEYDAYDRIIKTTLPDENIITRDYAAHSSEDLPIKISVNDRVLGEQVFDGLDRMIESTTGGRRSVYTFKGGDMQPCKVMRPNGLETQYVYRPELGEDPEERIAVESTAIYTYDRESARLLSTSEGGNTLAREYFSTGEVKSERSTLQGELPRVMHYEYSRQSRLMSYIDVLGHTQTYSYDPLTAQLLATELGTTRSTFTYDDFGQINSIETIDGGQRLKIDLAYDDFGRETLRTFDLGDEVIQTLSQTYDVADRMTQRVLKQADEVLRDETYEYDVRGRLWIYTCSGSQAPVDPYGKVIQYQEFGFDAQDNITYVQTLFEGGRNESFYEYTNPADPCQLKAVTHTLQPDYPARIEFVYDGDGGLTKDEAGRTLVYDSLGRLSSIYV
ncbi:RHS repeat protein [Pseudomonas lundensis]|uniref:RHS repeat domain-containing protein n=2 Tax=Pseudomonas lundensis TaxID=86185 RepID=UPI001472E230|nr:RHS repeat protein [Pseudomonas lundensis]NNA20328.1 RHS repeat protein [Pseudomonas lundensis]NNA37186.1 RHS repeat protein [Pseudomonas lundensis]